MSIRHCQGHDGIRFAVYFRTKEAKPFMKLALTVWEDRISPVFDSARKLLVAEFENHVITNRRYEQFDATLSHRLTKRLIELDISVLICGAISEQPAQFIEATGIKIIPFIAGNADNVLAEYVKDSLVKPEFLMPGCGRKRHRNKSGNPENKLYGCLNLIKGVMNMPKGDGTGPQGQGPVTGKGQGGCKAGKGGKNSGRGMGRGTGQAQGKGGKNRETDKNI
jgi:predicted Fe-Mo cluster-binding NifX family protein